MRESAFGRDRLQPVPLEFLAGICIVLRPAAANVRAQRLVEEGGTVTGETQTVLVLDDDRDLSTLVAYLLETEGYRVKTASDGRQGLEVVEQVMPGLILLDMKMPVMDGWAFAREFRARHGSRAPIVVLTAADDAKKRADEIGAAGWIGKPFDLDALVAIVGRYVQKELD